MSRSRRAGGWAVGLPCGVALLLPLLSATPASADYRDSFKKGIDSYDRKDWENVVRHMQAAIAERPTEGERLKLYGMRFEVYFPHFYLGAAYLQLGKCPEAVKEFKTSESQGAIRPTPKYTELQQGLKSCEGSIPAPMPSHSPTPVPTPRPAPTPAPTPVVTPAPAPTPHPPFTTTPTASPLPTPPERRLAPPELLKGAQAYFDGQYEDAVTLLSRTRGLKGRAAAQSLLLRSAARFALWKAGGQGDAELRRQSAEDAAACRRADPSLQPDAGAFSPEFADFFKSSR